MAQVESFIWGQGEDLTIELIYSEGSSLATAQVKDLSSGYSLRMDIVMAATKERVYTFNTEELPDVDPGDSTVPDSTIEGVLSSGANGSPNIVITIPRFLTLPPDGAIYKKMTGNPPTSVFAYDIFLRHIASDKQIKILKGNITIEESNTLWR